MFNGLNKSKKEELKRESKNLDEDWENTYDQMTPDEVYSLDSNILISKNVEEIEKYMKDNKDTLSSNQINFLLTKLRIFKFRKDNKL